MHNSNHFCILPWVHLQMKPNGQIKPCCRFDHKKEEYDTTVINNFNIKNKNLDDVIHSNFWEEIRLDMLANKKIAGCHKCDPKQLHTMRYNANVEWNYNNLEYPAAENHTPKLQFLELTTGRYCNLKCRTCSSDLSTTWEEDDKLIEGIYKDHTNIGFRKPYYHNPIIDLHKKIINFKELKFIKITGGESMITPSFIPFLDKIECPENIILEIYTNSSWTPTAKLLNRLKKFKYIKILLSIDGVGEINDYVRFPSKWQTVEKSVDTWIEFSKNNPKFSIVFSPTINLYNILQFKDMFYWWEDKLKKYYSETRYFFHKTDLEKNLPRWCVVYLGKFNFITLSTPNYLNCNLLPNNYKSKVCKEIKDICDYITKSATTSQEKYLSELTNKKLMKIITAVIKEKNSDLQTFINYTADLDKIRKQDIRQDIPDLWSAIGSEVTYKGLL